MEKEKATKILENLRSNIAKVIVGKDDVVSMLLTSLLTGGHVLLEDMPGTGKTKLAKSLAKSLGVEYKRIQFTPDLLPSDVLGLNYFSQKEGEFIFRKGPVFTSVLLADEINRATPRTQSSLLECMEERQVTIDGERRDLSPTFFVLATENPIETAGTYPLPEAQMDRFFMMLEMGYPTKEEEERILSRFNSSDPLEELKPVCSEEDIILLKEEATKIYVHPLVMSYIASITEKSRKEGRGGISPRGALALMKGAKSWALLHGRDYTTPDDVKAVALPILGHRMAISFSRDRRRGLKEVSSILSSVETPVEDWESR